MAVTQDDVRHIARLARLRFSEDEEEQMAAEMSRILGYMEKLGELDTTGVPPLAHVLDLQNVTRPDEAETRIRREDALEQAPDADAEHFRVPKVIE